MAIIFSSLDNYFDSILAHSVILSIVDHIEIVARDLAELIDFLSDAADDDGFSDFNFIEIAISNFIQSLKRIS